MSAPVSLIPMYCLRCQSALPAKPGEVAWVCPQCGQGMLLSGQKGLGTIQFHFSTAIPQGKSGWPFWMASGQVTFSQRETFRGNESQAMQAYWQAPRRVFVPAFSVPFQKLLEYGMQMVDRPPVLAEGNPAPFAPVTVMPDDMQALAEFVVLSIEATRNDDLRNLGYELRLDPPQLWILF
jgi:hypothetical protein